ncbi:MAG TPA: hypothetical protein VFG20_05425 [Planctomycetaceae bacterium]|nr:hypothetical protein [Planctomycetaceae bacterium]
MNRLRTIVVCLTALSFLGCGGNGRPRLAKVTGTVHLDGKPLEEAQVAMVLVTDAKSKYQRPSSATTDAQGRFTPQTYGKDDGLPIGKYKVGVQKRELMGQLPKDFDSENPGKYNLKYKWITPMSAAQPDSSGITVEVTSSGMKPDIIELKSAPQPEIELTGPQRKANEP